MSAVVNAEALMVARDSRGRTQKDVAEAAGVTQGLISKVENGVASLGPAEVSLVAKFLEYPEELFYEPDRVREVGSPAFTTASGRPCPPRS